MVFLYNTKEWFVSRNVLDGYLGNGPVLFDKVNGEIVVFSSGNSIEMCAEEYEKTIPSARLEMKVEPIPK